MVSFKKMIVCFGVLAVSCVTPASQDGSDHTETVAFEVLDAIPPECETELDNGVQLVHNRIDWAALLRRVFAIDILVCDRCSGPMKIIAVIPSSSIADKILDHLKLEVSQPATGPPEILH